MKELKVTGLAQENDFDTQGEVIYLLVLNKGELRLRISEDAAREVLTLMYANGHNKSINPTDSEPEQDQEEELEAAENESFGSPPQTEEVIDEDGVDQI